jgi:hypothetical protein
MSGRGMFLARDLRRQVYQDFSEFQTAQIDLSNADEQLDSRLFATLPSELRALIFAFALSPHDNVFAPYEVDRVYARPGRWFKPISEIALLQTCKRVFQEARLLPVAEATHTFWFFGGPWSTMRVGTDGISGIALWQASMTPEQREAVQFVHIFSQQCHLETLLGRQARYPMDFRARHLRLTIRNSDWWSWESPPASSDRLGICPWLPGRVGHQEMLAQPVEVDPKFIWDKMQPHHWGYHIGRIRDLQTFECEFEIDSRKKDQLDIVVERAKHWVFPVWDSNGAAVLKYVGPVVTDEWIGRWRLRDDNAFNLNPVVVSMDEESRRRTYSIAVVTFKRTTLGSEDRRVRV